MPASGSTEWGPLDQLAVMLTRTMPRGESGALTGVAEHWGGLWGMAARDIWPGDLLPPLSPPKRSFFERILGAGVADWPNCEALGDVMSEAHAWLGQENCRWILPHVQPFMLARPSRPLARRDQNIFTVISSTSQKALGWALLTCDIARRGPQFVRLLNEKTKHASPLESRYTLQEGDALGDLLALHVCIERLVSAAAVQRLVSNWLKEVSLAPHVCAERRPGGFRSSRFLRIYPWLAAMSQGSVQAQAWYRTLNLLIACSPLTQWVYFDVIPGPISSGVSSSLTRLGSPPAAWREIWLSQLSRSFLGALLSPPPAHEAAIYHRARLQKLEARRGPRASASRAQRQSNDDLAQQRRRLAGLESAIPGQHLDRLTMSSDVLGLRKNETASPYLHMRILDMLVRHLVISQTGAMQDRHSQTPPHLRIGPTPWAYLFDDTSPCFQAFLTAVFRLDSQTLNRQYRSHLAAVRQWVQRMFLVPQASIRDQQQQMQLIAEMVKQEGVSEDSARRLLQRFCDGQHDGVTLPPPNDRGDAPQEILSDWVVIVSNWLSDARHTPGAAAQQN